MIDDVHCYFAGVGGQVHTYRIRPNNGPPCASRDRLGPGDLDRQHNQSFEDKGRLGRKKKEENSDLLLMLSSEEYNQRKLYILLELNLEHAASCC